MERPGAWTRCPPRRSLGWFEDQTMVGTEGSGSAVPRSLSRHATLASFAYYRRAGAWGPTGRSRRSRQARQNLGTRPTGSPGLRNAWNLPPPSGPPGPPSTLEPATQAVQRPCPPQPPRKPDCACRPGSSQGGHGGRPGPNSKSTAVKCLENELPCTLPRPRSQTREHTPRGTRVHRTWAAS